MGGGGGLFEVGDEARRLFPGGGAPFPYGVAFASGCRGEVMTGGGAGGGGELLSAAGCIFSLLLFRCPPVLNRVLLRFSWAGVAGIGAAA